MIGITLVSISIGALAVIAFARLKRGEAAQKTPAASAQTSGKRESEPQDPKRGGILNDEATTEDCLDRLRYASALARICETCDTPMVIGIFGGWGAGKTSLMNLIECELAPDRVASVRFDAWQHQHDENPALSLMHTIVEQFNMSGQARKLLAMITLGLGTLVANWAQVNVDDLKKFGEQYEQERFQVRDARVRMRIHFQQLIELATNHNTRRLAIFIDDLDRCSPSATIAMLESLKIFLNLKCCVFFLAVDKAIVEHAITQTHPNETSEGKYLEKIVQLPFAIPPIHPVALLSFVSSLLPEALRTCNELLVSGLGDNPRAVKRFINVLHLNYELASVAGFPGYDVRTSAVVLILQQISPVIYSELVNSPQRLADLAAEATDPRIRALLKCANEMNVPMHTELIAYCIYLTAIAPAESSRKVGIVKWFNAAKGLGFLAPVDGGADVFVHISALERAGIKGLSEGEKVEFDLQSTRGKTSADNLTVVS